MSARTRLRGGPWPAAGVKKAGAALDNALRTALLGAGALAVAGKVLELY